jgi:hypothetical protein
MIKLISVSLSESIATTVHKYKIILNLLDDSNVYQ